MMFAELAGRFHSHDDLDSALQDVVRSARATVGGEHAGVMVRRQDGSLDSSALTDDLVRACDRAQIEAGQGPCLDAIDTGPVLRVVDMGSERRWPEFTPRARQLGVESMLACKLSARRGVKASLNLHSGRPHAFGDDAVRVAEIFALHATIALTDTRLRETLETGMRTRQRIGEATGLVMARFGLDAPQAFRLLVRASQHRNIKLRELAALVVGEGVDALPVVPPPRSGRPRP